MSNFLSQLTIASDTLLDMTPVSLLSLEVAVPLIPILQVAADVRGVSIGNVVGETSSLLHTMFTSLGRQDEIATKEWQLLMHVLDQKSPTDTIISEMHQSSRDDEL